MREAWTDERLDDLNQRVDDGFERVSRDLHALRAETKTEIRDLRGEMNARFERVDERLEAMQRTLVVFCGGIIAGLLGVIASILATGA